MHPQRRQLAHLLLCQLNADGVGVDRGDRADRDRDVTAAPQVPSLEHDVGDVVTVESRRGSVSLYARAEEGTPKGSVFIPFCYYEAAANKLTNPALDPFGKIPEFKYCAVRVRRGGEVAAHSSFGGGQLLEPLEA